ncbi:RMD1 family protein [Clostridiaceae bacterium 35-E11]
MKSAEFKAIVLSNEINLNKIAQHFGIDKKLKWEDTLTLGETYLKGIINVPEKKFVYIYYFGTVVFINLTHHEIMDIIHYLKQIEKSLNTQVPFDYIDDFKLDVVPNEEITMNYEYMTVPQISDYHLEILSTILAKSVALEKIEAGIEILSDDIEDIVDFLEKGHFNLSDEQLSKIWSKILRFKYNTISYIMLLDKPAITWINEDAENLFNQLSTFFELDDRYENIHQKTQILSDITEAFGSLTHTKRSTKLEWLIIILIAFEILITLTEKFVEFVL